MISLQIDEIIRATNGHLISLPVPNAFGTQTGSCKTQLISGISTDSRTVKKGDLFVALSGKNFDGHNFVTDVIRKKAAAIIVSSRKHSGQIKTALKSARATCIRVGDTTRALGDIARFYRSKLSARVIAVGGSNGKTTTKDMIAHILSKQYNVVKSPKSYNNYIGVPLTVLLADYQTEYLVTEVGTNKTGEIDYLAGILKPDIAVITNISATHLEGLKSIKGVFKEESSLFNHLGPDNIAIFDSSNKALKRLSKYAEYKRISFGIDSESDIRTSGIKIEPNCITFTIHVIRRVSFPCKRESSNMDSCWSLSRHRRGRNDRRILGSYKVVLPVTGSWNVRNALSAFAVCYAVGMSPVKICSALRDFKLPEMRMEKRFVGGVTFINDAYNANPTSVSLAIGDFSQMQVTNRKIFVFGEMCELGKYSKRFHQEIADNIVRSNIDIFIAIGKESRWTTDRLSQIKPDKEVPISFYYENTSKAIPSIKKIIKKGDTVFLKGSRANSLEKVVLCYMN